MKSEHDRREPSIGTLDDEGIGALVRAVADDWQMPPQRLDRPTWRDLTARAGARRRGRIARVAGPAVAAVLATVAVAFVAVWLTSPRPNSAISGASPATGSPTPGETTPGPSGPTASPASPLPALLRNGDLPAPSRVLVRLDGRYKIADLGAGALSPISIAPFTGPTSVLARRDGGWLCVCADWIERGSAPPSGAKVSLQVVDPSGVQTATYPIRTLEGRTDPRWAGSYQMEIADVGSAAWADGGTALIGWSVKLGEAGWTSGIDVIDTDTGAVVRTVELPTREPSAAADWPLTRVAPRISISPAGDRVLISSFWWVEDPRVAMPPSGTDHWTATLDGGALGALSQADATPDGSCGEFNSGIIDASSWYAVCPTEGGTLVAERHRLDGQLIDRTEIGALASGLENGAFLARSGDAVFLWDPAPTRLTRFDLGTGAIVKATAPNTVGSASPLDELAALGRRVGMWLAPSALAKVFLEPAIVVSADGSRVYALGVDAQGGGELGGSKGVFAFDSDTLEVIGHWPATADYLSLAVSPDGRFVYASGDSGRDAAGNRSSNDASITVFDTADGSVRLLAGQLGPGALWFPGPIVQ